MQKLKQAHEILNSLTVTGVDNCTKIAFISQLLKDTIEEMEKGTEDGERK